MGRTIHQYLTKLLKVGGEALSKDGKTKWVQSEKLMMGLKDDLLKTFNDKFGINEDVTAILGKFKSLKCCFPGCFQNPEFLLPRGFLLLSLCQLLGRTERLDISAVCRRSHNWPWGRSRSRAGCWGSGRCSFWDNDPLLE